MNKKFTRLTAAFALLVTLAIPLGMWGQTRDLKTETFENQSAGSTYNQTQTYNANNSVCGIGWTMYYGTVSTNNALVGSKSAQMRWYSSATSNLPYIKSTTAIDGLTNVAFKAKVGNTDVKMDVQYSTDGTNWSDVATAVTFSNTSVAEFSYDVPSGGKYIKIGVSSSSTAPGSGNYAFIVDDVAFTYSSSVPQHTVTYYGNFTGATDISETYNEGDDVIVAANTFSNPGYAFTKWNTVAGGTGTDYLPGATIENISSDIDLYAQWEESNETTYDFTQIDGFSNWGNGYSDHVVEYSDATVTFYAASHQTGTITDRPVTKAGPVTLVMTDESTLNGVTFVLTQWTTKTKTVELHYSTDRGDSYTSTNITSSNFTITCNSLPAGTNAVKITFSETSNQVGIASATIVKNNVSDPRTPTTTSITAPDGFNTDIYVSTTAGTLTASVYAGETLLDGATVTWASSNTSVATVASNGAVTLVGVGEANITADYAGDETNYKPSQGVYPLTVTSSEPVPGTVNNPYTVAQARTAIDNNSGTQGVYATGIVSAIPYAYTSNNGITFNMVDNSGDTEFLQAYKCQGDLAPEVAIGDVVVVTGNLTKFNSTYEFGQGCQVVSVTHPTVTVEAPTFSPEAGAYAETQTVTISCATTGATIYYTLDGTVPTSESNVFDQDLSINGTTTIKAIAIKGEDASTVATATYHIANSASNPYSVPEALAFHEYPTPGIYVHGTVSTAPTQNPTSNGELTYYISIDGEATDELEVYKGKGLDNAAFNDQTDIQVGDIVTIYGVVQVYGSTIEFASGNYLVEFERPASTEPSITLSSYSISATAEETTATLDITYEYLTISSASDFAIQYYDAEGEEIDEPDWISASVNEKELSKDDATYEVSYLIEANDGEARTTYFKVFADGGEDWVYSDLVTITQAAPVIDYATLPFAYDGNGTGTLPTGFTVSGLGTYSSSPAMQFNGTGDYAILKINERPGTLTFDIKGNSFGNGSTFKVQTSFDGITYADLETYTELGTTQSEEFNNLGENVRYIKWIYTEKVQGGGNVGLGNIALAEYIAPQEYTLTVEPFENLELITFVNDEMVMEGDGEIQVTNGNQIMLSIVADEGYVMETLLVNDVDHVNDIASDFTYTFEMPAENVTISATAVEIPMAMYAYSINGTETAEQYAQVGSTIDLIDGVDLNDDFTFAGWTLSANDVENFITEYTFPEEDAYVFYAVYAHTTGSAATRDGASYVKVTSTDDLENGNYLIVYEDGELAFDGSLETLDDTGNYIDVEINNDVIESAQEVDAAVFTIAAINGGYSIKSASGYYIGNTKTGSKPNGLSASEETVYVNHITFVDSDLTITSSDNEDITSLQFNSTSGQTRFRYFGSTQQPIQLYKYVGGETPTPQPTTAYYTRVFLNETVGANITIVGPSIVPSGQTLNMGTFTLNSDNYDNLIIEDGGQLKIANTVKGTIEKNITGYGNSTNGNYVLLATPASMDACNNTGMWPTTGTDHQAIQDNIDFYSFDQSAEMEWQNFKHGNTYFAGPYLMARGQGYLYANPNDVTLTLQTRGYSYPSGQTVIHEEYPFEPTNAAYTVPTNKLGYTETADWAGWNLVGNPFTCDAYLNRTYFRMNDTGDAIVEGDGAIKPCEGVFVVVTAEDKVVKFRDSQWLTSPSLSLNLNGNNGLMDRVSLHFDGSNNIKKFVLNENATKLYIQQGTTDYAVVSSNGEGEMPVSFKASKNGTYTLSINTENVEMNYLHLIDNMTGADIDLLATPSYSFEAKTTDYASRFRLVFNANNGSNENSIGNETFAYYNGSEWMINNMGEATLQVVDVMGRVLSTETVNGNATINLNQTPGVYMFRLVNGDSVKVQKVVVR